MVTVELNFLNTTGTVAVDVPELMLVPVEVAAESLLQEILTKAQTTKITKGIKYLFIINYFPV